MKKAFTSKTLQRDYVFRFRIHNYNFTCKVTAINKGFDGLLDVPYITYRCTVFSSVFYTIELPRLMSFPHNLNYRTFRSVIQDEVTSYILHILFN